MTICISSYCPAWHDIHWKRSFETVVWDKKGEDEEQNNTERKWKLDGQMERQTDGRISKVSLVFKWVSCFDIWGCSNILWVKYLPKTTFVQNFYTYYKVHYILSGGCDDIWNPMSYTSHCNASTVTPYLGQMNESKTNK